jgi:uncharacterized protein (TIGR02145 family)
MAASSYCAGLDDVRFTLSGTEPGATYLLYKNADTEPAATLAGNGKPAVFPGTHTAGIYNMKTAVTAQAFCKPTATSTREVKAPVTTAPGATATFVEFCPAPGVATGATWTLTDERDSKTYRVVKMPDNRVWMAQNLNYQSGLTWTPEADHPSIVPGYFTPDLIGRFWCPGAASTTISTLDGCNIWGGALYTWETVVSLDGLVTGGTWTNVAVYGNTSNHGRKSSGSDEIGGRGICPPGWHVPTTAEWGTVLNKMESSPSTAHDNHGCSTTPIGIDAGVRARSTGTCPDGSCASDQLPLWDAADPAMAGTDSFGFSVLPSGMISFETKIYDLRGQLGWFYTSSKPAGNGFISRYVSYNKGTVYGCSSFNIALSVRCINDYL